MDVTFHFGKRLHRKRKSHQHSQCCSPLQRVRILVRCPNGIYSSGGQARHSFSVCSDENIVKPADLIRLFDVWANLMWCERHQLLS